MARIKRELELQARMEAQKMARDQLSSYEPWGKPGAGAPNSSTIKMTKIQRDELYPDNELQAKHAGYASRQGYPKRSRSGRLKCKIKEDPMLRYQWPENSRKAVDNELRYKMGREYQEKYKKYLDDLVMKKHKAEDEELQKSMELEKRLNKMKGPWGKPGPGGTVWRNPRDIGTNFLRSMGWTDNSTFSEIQTEHRNKKREDCILPDIHQKTNGYIPSSDSDDKPHKSSNEMAFLDSKGKTKTVGNTKVYLTPINPQASRKQKRGKISKRTAAPVSTETVDSEENSKKIVGAKKDVDVPKKSNGDAQNKTPDSQILRMTGGIELVPLLARRRRVGARTLPSSDVTRMQEDECGWREVSVEYLQDLTSQMKMKCKKLEDNRKKSAENCKRHHDTWASLWGRPGHGAPRPGRNQRINLIQLLYQTPVY